MDETTSTSRVRGSLVALAAIFAPVLITVGQALSAQDSSNALVYVSRFVSHRDLHIAAGMIQAAGFLLLIPALVGLVQLVRVKGAAFATAGGLLGGIGAASLAVSTYMVTVVMGILTLHNRSLAVRVQDIARHSTLGSVGFFLGVAFSLGAILIAVGLIRAKVVPLWQSILLIVGAVAVAGPTPWFAGIPVTVAFIALGVQLWRRANPERPTTLDAGQTRPLDTAVTPADASLS